MFCTTFSGPPSEDADISGCLRPLYCQVLPNDELYMPLSSSLIELSIPDGEGACVLMGKILLDINMAVLEEYNSFQGAFIPRGHLRCKPDGKNNFHSEEFAVISGVNIIRLKELGNQPLIWAQLKLKNFILQMAAALYLFKPVTVSLRLHIYSWMSV